MKPRLLLTYSSGRSSGAMVDIILALYDHLFDIVILFANTGWEHEESLVFADKCAKRWGNRVIWVEAKVNQGRVACTFTRTTFEDASRNGEPLVEVVKKYGLPNAGYPHCTRELKENAIESYLRSIGWAKGSYLTCIGIRGDEPKRLKRGLCKSNGQVKVYPLADWFYMDKQMVFDYWKTVDFDLQIPDHLGNCVGCFRKSNKKLAMASTEEPEYFELAKSLEADFGHIGLNKIKGVHVAEPRMLYRGEISAENLIASFNLEKVA